MRKLLSLAMAGLFTVALGACQEQPTTLDDLEVSASHGPGNGDVIEASAVYRAVGTEAAAMNDFRRGERVGTLSVTDDGSELTVTGSAHGLDPEVVYVSLFYDKRSSAQGSPSSPEAATSAAACEPGTGSDLGSDHPQFLTPVRWRSVRETAPVPSRGGTSTVTALLPWGRHRPTSTYRSRRSGLSRSAIRALLRSISTEMENPSPEPVLTPW